MNILSFKYFLLYNTGCPKRYSPMHILLFIVICVCFMQAMVSGMGYKIFVRIYGAQTASY